jgi:hypothetical protein
MPCIYARFMEKEARQWREIYKALQLLEYLIKHGSERVVDDARSHISTIKMLRNFHYIDDKGKDEGVNGEIVINLCPPPELTGMYQCSPQPCSGTCGDAFRRREDSWRTKES